MTKILNWIMFSGLIIVWTAIAPVLSTASAEIKFGILPRLEAVDLYTLFNPLAWVSAKGMGEKVGIVT